MFASFYLPNFIPIKLGSRVLRKFALFAAFLLVASFVLMPRADAQSGTAMQAVIGEDGRWSVPMMVRHLETAKLLADSLLSAAGESATCQNEWRICKDIQRELSQAYEHAYYVFHHNTDFPNQCLHRRLDNLVGWAGRINEWNNWLWQRGFKLGLADMAQQIRDYQHWPRCQSVVRPSPSPQPATILGQKCNYYKNLGHTLSTARPGIYNRYCSKIASGGASKWAGHDRGWSCLDSNDRFVRSVDPVAMCLESYPQKSLLGVCFNPNPLEEYYRYAPICVY